MGFADLWKFSFDLLDKIVLFCDSVVSVLTTPIGDFIYDVMPNPIVESFVWFLDWVGTFNSEESILTYILSTGVTAFIVWAVVKFFVAFK